MFQEQILKYCFGRHSFSKQQDVNIFTLISISLFYCKNYRFLHSDYGNQKVQVSLENVKVKYSAFVVKIGHYHDLFLTDLQPMFQLFRNQVVGFY